MSTHFLDRTNLDDMFIMIDNENFKCLKCPEICQEANIMRRHIIRRHWKAANPNMQIKQKVIKPKRPILNPGQGLGRKCPRAKKCPISLEDPGIRASFEAGGAYSLTGAQWTCGVQGCLDTFALAHNLKKHYLKHDPTLFVVSYKCDNCSYTNKGRRNKMELHMEEHHQGKLFPKDDMEDKGYTSVKNEKWTRFMKESNILIELNPNFKSHDSGREWEQKSESEVFQTIMEHCTMQKKRPLFFKLDCLPRQASQ